MRYPEWLQVEDRPVFDAGRRLATETYPGSSPIAGSGFMTEIPDGDYQYLVYQCGIEAPSSRIYWEGFNSGLARRRND